VRSSDRSYPQYWARDASLFDLAMNRDHMFAEAVIQGGGCGSPVDGESDPWLTEVSIR